MQKDVWYTLVNLLINPKRVRTEIYSVTLKITNVIPTMKSKLTKSFGLYLLFITSVLNR